uniref:Uncharacterized protein n=1 Tax=Anguilla anguilla TaxID=7936 RepID=A0A0E9QH39_ANGAN
MFLYLSKMKSLSTVFVMVSFSGLPDLA